MKTSRRTVAFVLIPLAILLLGMLVWTLSPSSDAASRAAASEAAPSPTDSSLRKASFAGGCFWCIESAFQDEKGVKKAISGFAGGTQPDPTYSEVSSGETNYTETVQVTYDPDQIGYEQLLDIYWHYIDPTDAGGQFADRGSQYRPVIFYHNQRQQRLARQSKQQLAKTGPFEEPIVVKIQPLERFYAAEEYHQDYYKKHPERYAQYYEASGRGPFLKRIWGSAHPQVAAAASAPQTSTANMQASAAQAVMTQTTSTLAQKAGAGEKVAPNGGGEDPWRNFEMPSEEKLRAMLTPLQYRVTQEAGTEPAFRNKYYDNKRSGIYVDIVSGEPLFSSKTKFHSGTGWPSFYKPLEPELVVTKKDYSAGMVRTEVRSRYADSHLGHVFEWSGEPSVPTGLRYCLNSAALRFIPSDQLEEEGYGEYKHLFK